jgi:glyoxylase-like metal-dependent hydrolase (beta-lactamase superfamily II)
MSENLQWKIGDITLTRIEEQMMALTPGYLLPRTSDELLAPHLSGTDRWAFDSDGQLRISIHALGIEEEGKKVIVDTCFGAGPLPEGMEALCDDGTFLRRLTDAGFGRSDVDLVICTHLHVDHVGWNTMIENGRRVPTFSNARYVMSKLEFEHWKAASEEQRLASGVVMFDDAVTPLVEYGVIDLKEPPHRLSETIEMVPTPGHSPGHISVRVTSQDQVAFITGDCAHSPIQFGEPDWYAMNDTDPQASCSTRRRLISDLSDSPVLVIGTHFPPPTAGHLVTTDEGVQFRPLR